MSFYSIPQSQLACPTTSPATAPINHAVPRTRLQTILLAALFLLPFLSRGQGYIEGVNVSQEYLPLQIKDGDVKRKFDAQQFRFNVGVPYFLREDKSQYLVLGGNFESISFSGTRPGFAVKNIYSIQPTIGYSRRFNNKLNLTAVFIPTLSSDLKDIKSEGIQLGGVVRGAYQLKPNFSLRGTLGFRQQFYGPQYIVLAGFDWKVSEKWRLYGEAPSYFTANYAINPKTNTGFTLSANNMTYRLKEQDRYVKYSYGEPGLFLERYVGANWALRGTVAYALIRHLEVFEKNDKVSSTVDLFSLGTEPTPISPEITKGATFKISLGYRIKPGPKPQPAPAATKPL